MIAIEHLKSEALIITMSDVLHGASNHWQLDWPFNNLPPVHICSSFNLAEMTWLLSGIWVVGMQDRSIALALGKASQAKILTCGTEHHPLVMCVMYLTFGFFT